MCVAPVQLTEYRVVLKMPGKSSKMQHIIGAGAAFMVASEFYIVQPVILESCGQPD